MTKREPIIGIPAEIRTFNGSLRNNVNEGEVKAILKHGGLPLLIPTRNPKIMDKYIDLIDGLLLPGGADVAPRFYGEEPIPENGGVDPLLDESEINLIHSAFEKHIPIFAICRGIQILNVALGGSLYQDLAAQYPGKTFQHTQKNNISETAHFVLVEEGSEVVKSFVDNKVLVNSHHQAIKDIAPGLVVTATAGDGVIEAVESTDGLAIGVQWHPELMFEQDEAEDNLFERYIEKVKANNSLRVD
ncbi:gamma-glutamyl-gamma-aminobutyrate hydrolase family protein [Lentilactobacillus sp. Marseille-Q4993]|uniref:gamma-glutamyl-gamma-aminobutyrate hydrolase family protein n=1 Tax=Lentilactobacillus sp. Marseille-Q4993 TaxID=3039492 RepID=UPI0024BBF78A|nr:gamma-glutamyl-gamma-aminobutyrate hydrolase family protein [Lentilactobacillus sp. Marseille-Q4993]